MAQPRISSSSPPDGAGPPRGYQDRVGRTEGAHPGRPIGGPRGAPERSARPESRPTARARRRSSVSARRDELLVAVGDEARLRGPGLGGRTGPRIRPEPSPRARGSLAAHLGRANSSGERRRRLGAARAGGSAARRRSRAALRVRTSVPTGRPAAVLAEMALTRRRRLQHRPHGAAASVFGGSVAADVVARADVPVVSVPRGLGNETRVACWRTGATSHRSRGASGR